MHKLYFSRLLFLFKETIYWVNWMNHRYECHELKKKKKYRRISRKKLIWAQKEACYHSSNGDASRITFQLSPIHHVLRLQRVAWRASRSWLPRTRGLLQYRRICQVPFPPSPATSSADIGNRDMPLHFRNVF